MNVKVDRHWPFAHPALPQFDECMAMGEGYTVRELEGAGADLRARFAPGFMESFSVFLRINRTRHNRGVNVLQRRYFFYEALLRDDGGLRAKYADQIDFEKPCFPARALDAMDACRVNGDFLLQDFSREGLLTMLVSYTRGEIPFRLGNGTSFNDCERLQFCACPLSRDEPYIRGCWGSPNDDLTCQGGDPTILSPRAFGEAECSRSQGGSQTGDDALQELMIEAGL